MTSFNECFEDVATRAPNVFLNDGFHTSILFLKVEGNDAIAIMQLAYRDDKEKRRLYGALEAIAQRARVEFFVNVCEAWMLESKPLDDMLGELRPSKNPRRREALIVIGHTRDGEHRCRIWLIEHGPLRLVPWEEDKEDIAPVSLLQEVLFGQSTMPGLHIDDRDRITLDEREETPE